MGTIRYCSQIKNLSHILAASNQNIIQAVDVKGRHRSYSRDKDCCRDVPQGEGKTVVPWPRTPMWPCNYPEEPQLPNCDPYKIKSPDVMVPPLPPSNAKEVPSGDVWTVSSTETADRFNVSRKSSPIRSWFQQTPIVHPDNWKQKTLNKMQRLENEVGSEMPPRLGYHGKTKYKYAFHEPWNPLDRLTLLAQAEKEEHPEVQQDAEANDEQLT